MNVVKLAIVTALVEISYTLAGVEDTNTGQPDVNPPLCYTDHSLWREIQELDKPTARKLDTLHYQGETKYTGTIPRDQVVQALQDAFESEDNFVVLSTNGDHTHVIDITRNEMDVKPPESELGDYSGAFQVTNKFVVGSGTTYNVECPAAASGNECQVHVVSAFGSSMSCLNNKKNVDLSYDNIPSKCLDKMYKMRLQALAPHFFLVNVKENASSADGCPPNVVLDSSKGEKWKSVMVMEQVDGLPMVELGSATLGDILKAEQAAEPLRASEYNLTKNSCAHYAQRIWRALGFEETQELATFLIDNIVGSEFFERIAKNHRESGGLRALAAIAMGKDSLKVYMEGAVYSQLDLS